MGNEKLHQMINRISDPNPKKRPMNPHGELRAIILGVMPERLYVRISQRLWSLVYYSNVDVLLPVRTELATKVRTRQNLRS